MRAVDRDIVTGVWPDVTAHDWNILVIAGPIWLGDNSSVTKWVFERLYSNSHLLNHAGQFAYYRPVAGVLSPGTRLA